MIFGLQLHLIAYKVDYLAVRLWQIVAGIRNVQCCGRFQCGAGRGGTVFSRVEEGGPLTSSTELPDTNLTITTGQQVSQDGYQLR